MKYFMKACIERNMLVPVFIDSIFTCGSMLALVYLTVINILKACVSSPSQSTNTVSSLIFFIVKATTSICTYLKMRITDTLYWVCMVRFWSGSGGCYRGGFSEKLPEASPCLTDASQLQDGHTAGQGQAHQWWW